MSKEVELKLALLPELAARLGGLAPVSHRAVSPATEHQYRAIYFDTPDHQLAAARMALRVRREAHGWVQTLKQSGYTDLGLSSRVELNWPVPRLGLDLQQLEDSPLGRLPDWTKIRPRLKRCFTTQFLRRSWLLGWSDGTQIELALDQGAILAGRSPQQRSTMILELEMELKQGQAHRLWDLALELLEHGPLVPLIASKAQRGYELLGPPAVPVKSKPVADPQQSRYGVLLAHGIGQALKALHHNLRHAHQDDAEFIHQARVALRRIRSLLRGAQALEWHEPQRKVFESLRLPLRMLGQRLGEVRDADVLCFDTLPRLVELFKEPWGGPLLDMQEQARGKREAAYAALLSMWETPQYGRGLLMIEHLAWDLMQSPERFVPKHSSDVQSLALRQLGRQHDAMWRASRDLSRLDVTKLHELRIQAKRMRYLLDFWITLWKKSELRRYRSGLIALIESLGTISDDANAMMVLEQLQVDPRLLEAIGEHARAQRNRRLPAIAAALVELDLAEMPWRPTYSGDTGHRPQKERR